MLTNEIKAIFIDLDWTLFNHNVHDWDYISIEGLKQAQKKGVKVFACTARPYDGAKCLGLFRAFTPDGLVTANGAVAIINDEVITSKNFPNNIVKEVIKVSDKYNVCVEINTEKSRFMNKEMDDVVRGYLDDQLEVIPYVGTHKDDRVSAILMFTTKDMDETLKSELPSGLIYKRFNDYGVDLCYYDMNKSVGMKEIMDHLGLTLDQVMAIGDESGDKHMFSLAKYKVAMGNGKQDLKDVATLVSKSVDESGVLYALQYYGVI